MDQDGFHIYTRPIHMKSNKLFICVDIGCTSLNPPVAISRSSQNSQGTSLLTLSATGQYITFWFNLQLQNLPYPILSLTSIFRPQLTV